MNRISDKLGLNTFVYSLEIKPTRPAKDTHVDQNIKNVTTECCACAKTKEEIHVEDIERRYQIQFENFLHNQMYRKK